VSCTICPAMRESRELFKSLFPPYGLYGLYRASVPIQMYTLPYIYLYANKCLAQYVRQWESQQSCLSLSFHPYGLYGLYRVSVPIQICTLPYIYMYANKFLAQYVRQWESQQSCLSLSFPPTGCMAYTERQCLYKGSLYLIFICVQASVLHSMSSNERVKRAV